MILNSGLDACCTVDARAGTSLNNFSDTAFTLPFTYAAFGTGSTEPSATDTTLDNQVGSRSNNTGGFTVSNDAGLDANTNTIWYEVTFPRVLAITSNVNATEWGLASGATGNLSVRDLFRADPNDPESSPITLTLEDGDQLQLWVTLRVEAAWEMQPASFVITGTAGNDTNGTHDGFASVTSGASSALGQIGGALAAAWPGGAHNSGAAPNGYVWRITDDPTEVPVNGNVTGSGIGTFAQLAYSAGTYYRDYTVTVPTSDGNGDHYGWNAGSHAGGGQGSASAGYRFVLEDPPILTKTSTHRLTLTLRKHISRL